MYESQLMLTKRWHLPKLNHTVKNFFHACDNKKNTNKNENIG